MADIRIKDLGTTASVTASDDFMAVDGTTNGTRKLSAAAPAFLTSVTTPSLTSPASTDLTLGTGTSGAAITVLSASNNVGIGTTSPTQKLEVYNSSGHSYLVLDALNVSEAGLVLKNAGTAKWYINRVGSSNDLNFYNATGAGASQMYFKNDGNVGIGTTTPGAYRLNVAGGDVYVASSTAGSSSAGALVVTGGLSAGGASYIGGNLTAVGTGTHTFGTTNTVTMAAGVMTLQGTTGVTSGRLRLQSSNTDYGNGVTLLYSSVSPDAYARAWQIASNFIANGNLDFLVSASNSTQAINAAISFTSAGGINAAGAVSVSGTAATFTSGTGSPESVKTAPVGSLYTRTDGGASTTLYVKESGAGNTGWIAK